MMNLPKRLFKALIVLSIILIANSIYAQSKYAILEDEKYNFSLVTQTEMTMSDNEHLKDENQSYRYYEGSTVTEKDTLYYRVDIWENPIEEVDGSPDKDVVVLDSTLQMVEDRLKGERLYMERISRNGWPAIQAKYQIKALRKSAKVLLVKRQSRYYVLTVIAGNHSTHHDGINAFLHSFTIIE